MPHYLSLLSFATVLALSAPPPALAGNACSLVSQAEAAAAMGVPSLPGQERPEKRRGEVCRYYSSDHRRNVFVGIRRADVYEGVRQAGGKPVPGVPGALFLGGSAFLQNGTRTIQVGLIRSMDDMKAVSPQLVNLLKTAAGRI